LAVDHIIIFRVPNLAIATKAIAVINGENKLECTVTNISFMTDAMGKLEIVYVNTRDKNN